MRQRLVVFLLKHKIKLTLFLLLSLFYGLWLPDRLFNKSYSTVLLDDEHQLLAAQIASDGQWRFPQSDSVPYKFRNCLLYFEDEYFYYHPGINPFSIFRSLKTNIRSGEVKSGGSTITMQVARMMRSNPSRNYFQKLIECALSFRIELSYKKSSILNLYSSHAPFGSNVVGLSAASWRYFGRSPDKLSWAESAVLAVLPNAPGLIYPGRNSDRLKIKRDRLLKKLLQKNCIDSATYRLSVLEPLPQKPYPIPRIAPHLLARCVIQHGTSQVYVSTVQKNLQMRVDEALNKHIQSLQANQINNACALVADVESGKVLAYVGNAFSESNAHENFVDVVFSPRSTGSILKPFLYAFMLDENKLLPNSLVEDVPTRIGAYGPKNFNLTYDGLVPANEAIARSLNVPAVKMLQDYGNTKFHQRLKQLGFTTFSKPSDHYGLSLILGGGEACLFEIASAYASMGRALLRYSNTKKTYGLNTYHPLSYLREPIESTSADTQKSDLLKASSIYFTFKAMTELLRPQDYVGWMQFLSKNNIAWKTGTSFGFRDAWAVGLNGKYLVAVWVGNADGEGRPDLTGTAAAAPLMFSIFNTLNEKKWFTKPTSDLVQLKVCKQSGFRASEICDDTEVKDVPSGAEHSKVCPFHKTIHLDASGRYRVNSSCYSVENMQHKAWFLPSPVQEYFYKQRSLSFKALPPYLPGCFNELNHRQMDLLYPRDGFEIYVPVDETENKSRCVFKALHKRPGATLFWHLDGEFVGSTEKYHQLSLSPSPGEHVLEITDDAGESLVCEFKVLKKQQF